MKHRIAPKVDCVFKALLGAEENRHLLVHFLNAVLVGELNAPISDVEILNPYNDKEFLDDKLSIVDVKAQDRQGQIYQIEIQLASYRSLPARILYTWADLYSQQLHSGQDYAVLQPTYAIWLLGEPLFPNDPDYIRDFRLRDSQGRVLEAHGGIWLLELDKFAAERIETEQQRWLKFFKEGEQLDAEALPNWMKTDEMRQVMSTLKRFSEKDRDYHAYQARQNYLRQQRTIEKELEQERQEKQAALQEKQAALQREKTALQREETALQREEAALTEIERLKALLAGKRGGET